MLNTYLNCRDNCNTKQYYKYRKKINTTWFNNTIQIVTTIYSNYHLTKNYHRPFNIPY